MHVPSEAIREAAQIRRLAESLAHSADVPAPVRGELEELSALAAHLAADVEHPERADYLTRLEGALEAIAEMSPEEAASSAPYLARHALGDDDEPEGEGD